MIVFSEHFNGWVVMNKQQERILRELLLYYSARVLGNNLCSKPIRCAPFTNAECGRLQQASGPAKLWKELSTRIPLGLWRWHVLSTYTWGLWTSPSSKPLKSLFLISSSLFLPPKLLSHYLCDSQHINSLYLGKMPNFHLPTNNGN